MRLGLAASPIPLPLRIRLVRCRGCGTRFVHPAPSAVALRARYEAEYQAGKWGAVFGASDPREPPRRAHLLDGLEPGQDSRRLLDVGAEMGASWMQPRRQGGARWGSSFRTARSVLSGIVIRCWSVRWRRARGTPVCGDHLLGRARAPARPGGYPWCRGPFARAAWSPGRVTAQRVRHRGVDGRDALALPRSSRLWAPGPPGAFPAPKAPRGRGVGGGTPGNAWLGGSAGLARPRGLQRRAPASGLAPRPAEWRCEIHIGRGFVPAVFARLPPVSDGYGRAGGGGRVW